MTDQEFPSRAQIRAARALLGWSQQQLAEASGKHRRTIAKFELGEGTTEPKTVADLKNALEKGGVVFLGEGDDEGVRRGSSAAGAHPVNGS